MLKEINIQVPEAHRVPKKMDAKRTTSKHSIIKMPKAKDKEKILKAAKEKQMITYKGVPIDCQLISQKNLCKLEQTGKKYSK